MSAEDAGKAVSADLKKLHPDWPNTNAAGFVKSVYAEDPIGPRHFWIAESRLQFRPPPAAKYRKIRK